MQPGTIVRIPKYTYAWVALPVTRLMLNQGINARKIGMHLFGGPWYGSDLMSAKTYGKILPLTGAHKVIGHVSCERTQKSAVRVKSRAIKRLEKRVAHSQSKALERMRNLAVLHTTE